MNKICTSIEQSKKLIELGIDISTADMYWHRKLDGTYNLRINDIIAKLDIPAWSLSALLSLLKPYGSDTYTIWGTLNGGAGIEFADLTDVCFQEDNPLDAVFEMIVWLKENNKI